MAKRKQRGKKLTKHLVRPPKCKPIRNVTSTSTNAEDPPNKKQKVKMINETNQQSNSNKNNNKKKRQFSSMAESLALIKVYHTLNKRLEQNARDETIMDEKEREKRA